MHFWIPTVLLKVKLLGIKRWWVSQTQCCLLSSSSGFIPSQALCFSPKEYFVDGSAFCSQPKFGMFHTLHTGLGMTDPLRATPHPSPLQPRAKWSLLLYLSIVKETSWQLWCIYDAVQLVYSHFVTSILIFLLKLENSSHLELRGEGSTWMCVVWSFQGSDRVEGCFCVRNLSECHSRSRLCALFELVERALSPGEQASPKTWFTGNVSWRE